MYRIRIHKYLDYKRGKYITTILYIVEKKRKYWWGWSVQATSSSEEEAKSYIFCITDINLWKDQFIYN